MSAKKTNTVKKYRNGKELLIKTDDPLSISTKTLHVQQEVADIKHLINVLGTVLYGMKFDDINEAIPASESLNDAINDLDNELNDAWNSLSKIVYGLNDYSVPDSLRNINEGNVIPDAE